MDRNFHNDDFERLLREKSNEFRMYPSKRIWHSVYNNIHPGKKWPSIAMSITLITSLFLIGYLNTRNNNLLPGSGNTVLQQKTIAQTKLSPQPIPPFLIVNTENSTISTPLATTSKTSTVPNNGLKIIVDNRNKEVANSNVANTKMNLVQPISNDHEVPFSDSVLNTNNASNNEIAITNNSGDNSLPVLTDKLTVEPANSQIAATEDEPGFLTAANKTPINPLFEYAYESKLDFTNQLTDERISLIIESGNSFVEKNKLYVSKNEAISVEEKAWIENYAFYNKPAVKKWANKLALQIYATPSVVYRVLSIHPDFRNTVTSSPFAISTPSQDINNYVNQKPSIGLEVGTGLQYSISKNIKLKTGLQLNFTRYNAEAFQNSHPVTTLLTMHDFNTNTSYQVARATPYSNKSGLESVKLHNETFQISLPMGIDIKLLGNEQLQWNIGATIQPTYVAGGKSYLISTDRLNYVKESDMLNRWNLNAGFETNLTYKSGGLTYQIGPQFRTQVYSTNNKKYAVEERLVNFGLKLGIAKTIN